MFGPLGCVINGVRRVYFHFSWGKEGGENDECLHCHWPLTCPAGWKGFLSHPSHASAPLRGAQRRRGTRAREAGYLDNTPLPLFLCSYPSSPIYQPAVSAVGQRTVESQEVLRGKSPHAVNPLIFQLGLTRSLRLLFSFFIDSNSQNIRKITFGGASTHHPLNTQRPAVLTHLVTLTDAAHPDLCSHIADFLRQNST